MATIDVKDAAGSTVAIEKPLAPGRAAATAARPVALSNEDFAVLDGLEAVLGTTADAAATAGSTGSLAAKLRLATTQLEAIKTAVEIIDNWNSGLPAGEAVIGKVGMPMIFKSVTLTPDTAAFASGDVIADSQQVDAALRVADGTGVLNSIMLIDESDQKAALTLVFLSSNVALGTENAAPSISDANAANVLGFIDISVADYKDYGGVSVVNIRNIGMDLIAVSGTDDIYVGAINGTGTPTYAANALKLRLGIWHN